MKKYEVIADVNKRVKEYRASLDARVIKCFNPLCPEWLLQEGHRTYCSDACSAEAEKGVKRKWWREKGNTWRLNRKTA